MAIPRVHWVYVKHYNPNQYETDVMADFFLLQCMSILHNHQLSGTVCTWHLTDALWIVQQVRKGGCGRNSYILVPINELMIYRGGVMWWWNKNLNKKGRTCPGSKYHHRETGQVYCCAQNFHSQPALLIHISCCLNGSKNSTANLKTHLNIYLNFICFWLIYYLL